MRRLFALILVLVALCAGGTAALAQEPAPAPADATQRADRLRYADGKKYHREGCRYLSQSKIPITLKGAKAKGYTACSVCRPVR
jgi:hypothetical protein